MTANQFERLCNLLQGRWDRHVGAVALLRTFPAVSDVLRLTVPADPGSIVGDNCLLWKDDDLLYRGPLKSAGVRSILSRYRICSGVITDVRHTVAGAPVCLRCDRCGKQGCCVKDAERHSVRGAKGVAGKRPGGEPGLQGKCRA